MTEKQINRTTKFQQRWPDYQAFADDAGVTVGNAQIWRFRDSIPPAHDLRIAEGAASRGIGTVLEILRDLQGLRTEREAAA